MLIMYSKITKEELETTTTKAVEGVTQWFLANPTRRVCNMEFVYGKRVKVRKKHIKQDILDAAKLVDTI